MKSRQGIALLVVGLVAFAIVGGARFSKRSPLFTLHKVRVDGDPQAAEALIALAEIPLHQVSLFAVDLEAIEKRILKNPWISSVHLKKKLPDTLVISPTFRAARALYQSENGQLSYVDSEGKQFGHFSLLKAADLPVLSGFKESEIKHALELLDLWDREFVPLAQVSEISMENTKGLRVFATYPISGGRGRTTIELGDWHLLNPPQTELKQLKAVLNYLSNHGQSASLIWADIGKKIVVKIARGS
ncbi:FtsQ-type POTRA domain-containing protein [bacterium]|jgi:cell division septal protein FtsQ|nr:FtsQ-type POTRA domain-containing protein [bacterium]